MTPDDLDALILRHLDGTLTPADARSLQEHLDAHPADAARLLDLSDEDLMFRQAFRAPTVTRRRSRRSIVRSVPATSWGLSAAAAAVVIGLVVIATRIPASGPDEFVRSRNARLAFAEKQAHEDIVRIVAERLAAERRLEELRTKPAGVEREQVEAVIERSHAEEQEARALLMPTPHETVAAAMIVETAEGDADVLVDGVKRKLRPGQPLQYGQGLEVAGPRGRVVVSYPDGTRFELSGNGAIRDLQGDASGKRVVVVRGRVTAEISPQPEGRPMVFSTPHAEARVLGTSIVLSVDAATRLDVRHGKVRFAKASKSVEVSGGETSTAAEGKELSVAKLDSPWRIVEGHEDANLWTATGQDPLTALLSADQASGGKRSLKFAYSWRDPARGGKGWCIIQHPQKFAAGDAWLSFRVYIASCDETVKLGAMTWMDDEGAWHMGDVRLDKCPRQTWFTFAVPLRAGAKKNNPKGGSVYDADRVAGFGLSLVGGSATVYVDDVALSAECPPAARGPKR